MPSRHHRPARRRSPDATITVSDLGGYKRRDRFLSLSALACVAQAVRTRAPDRVGIKKKCGRSCDRPPIKFLNARVLWAAPCGLPGLRVLPENEMAATHRDTANMAMMMAPEDMRAVVSAADANAPAMMMMVMARHMMRMVTHGMMMAMVVVMHRPCLGRTSDPEHHAAQHQGDRKSNGFDFHGVFPRNVNALQP